MLTAEAADEPDAEPTLAAAVVYFGVFGPPTLSLVYLTPRTVTVLYTAAGVACLAYCCIIRIVLYCCIKYVLCIVLPCSKALLYTLASAPGTTRAYCCRLAHSACAVPCA